MRFTREVVWIALLFVGSIGFAQGTRTVAKISSASAVALVDTNDAPDLKLWGDKAGRLCVEWFPKVAALLPSEGFVAPKEVTLYFDPSMKGVAHAANGRITISASYVRAHPEDWGMVVHELLMWCNPIPQEVQAGWWRAYRTGCAL
jgi:hypothetical protein